MRKLITIIIIVLIPLFALSQASSTIEEDYLRYVPSDENPYGQAHPNAPQQIKDFAPMIGKCLCKSETRKPDGTWNEPGEMVWIFKYIMNGKGVQDETFKADGIQSGSIRQFDTETNRWVVHYYSSNATPETLPSWLGGKKGDKIVLYRDQKAPNGMDGSFRLTFYDMNDEGYKWIGEWVSPDESIVYPTWKIDCKRQ